MLELADHILDISENSVRAGAGVIEICVDEDSDLDLLTIKIIDDGCGIKQEEIKKVQDPFYTTKKVRRVGLGLPLLADAAKMSGGSMNIESAEGKGTMLTATFQLGHLDRQPMGNINNALVILIAGNSGVDFCYEHKRNKKNFRLDTRIIRREIEDVPINHPEVLKYIRSVIEEGLSLIESKA
jgi:hypothetical protein